MTMRLAWLNRVDDASLTADQQIATLPATNVRHPFFSKRWHTPAGVAAAYLVLDLGAALACDVWAVVGTNLTAAATVRLRASDADPNVAGSLLYDSTVLASKFTDAYPAAYGVVSPSTAARYWRFDLADASLDHLEVGRVWLGPAWTPSQNHLYGWSKTWLDESVITPTRSGQDYADLGGRRRRIDFAIDLSSAAEMSVNAFECSRYAGLTRDVLAILDPDAATIHEDSILGTLERAEPLVQERLRVNRMRFTIKERIHAA